MTFPASTRNTAGLLLALACLGFAHAQTPLPEGGVSLLADSPLSQPGVFWGGNFNGQPVAAATLVEAEHPAFTQALRVSVANPAGQFWNGAVQLSTNGTVAEGDVLLIRLFFRSIESNDESGVGFATVFPQGPAPGYNKYLTREITATRDWQEYLLPFEMTEALTAGQLSLQIGAGAGSKTQIWEVGGVTLLNYRDTRALAELPITRPTYAGRAADAAWRQAAAERIERHRKGDFSIQILDLDGTPLPDLDLSVEFRNHAYHFGSVVVASRILGEGLDNETYREKFLELFNQSGPENDTKWAPWAGEWGSNFNQQQTIAALQWLKERDIYTRGHVMVWPSKRNLPTLMQGYLPEGNPAGADPFAKQVVLDHIDDIATKTAPLLDEWDVLNEPYDNHYLMDAFGDEVMVDWFERARQNLPRHGLYLNDYSILSAGGRDFAHQQHFEDTIAYLRSQNAPITGIGMQGHFSSSPTSIELVYSILQRYHSAFPELDIRVTEFDISTDDEEMQADYTRDFLTIAFSHPATVGVQCWGFWENAHWRPTAAMYASDWREKPNAAAWRRLSQEVWWNDFHGATDAQGAFAARGFYGDYTATFTHAGVTYQLDFSLLPGGPAEIVASLSQLAGEPSPNTEPDFAIVQTANGPRLQLSQTETKIHYLERSFNLESWDTLLKLEDLVLGARYRIPLSAEDAVFYRLASE